MGAKYTSQSTSGYNSSPPADDGTQTASNLIAWAGIKTKIGDVLKTFAEAINTALVATLNLSPRAISSADSGVAGDHWRTIQVTGTTTYTLPDAATVATGWVVTVTNIGTSVATIARTTGADTINGVAQNLNLGGGDAVTLKVNAAGNGFITDSARSVDLSRVDGRLTLTSATPVTTADVTSATTVYFTPYKGNKIALFDGTGTWNELTFSEKSLTPAAAANTLYDVFAYNDAGSVSIEATAWTNVSSRATALVLQNGVLVKAGATTRRYLGTFSTTGIAGQVEDSLAKRYVWNYYNRVRRQLKVVDATNNWAYTTAAYRQANNSGLNQVDLVIGVAEDSVSAYVGGRVANDNAGGGVDVAVGIGLDSTTVDSSAIKAAATTGVANRAVLPYAMYDAPIAAGRHYLAWLEYSAATGTSTWDGDGGTAYLQTGLTAAVWA